MLRPTWFVVSRWQGREHAALYYDELPKNTIRGVIYVLRLDRLPDAERWLRRSVRSLYRTYRVLAERGALPRGEELGRK